MPGAVAPARLVCSKLRKNAHGQFTGTTEHTPAFPAQWFTAYTRSPRSAGLSSLRRLRARHPQAWSQRRGIGTTWFRRPPWPPSSVEASSVHRPPRHVSWRPRSAPPCEPRDGKDPTPDL